MQPFDVPRASEAADSESATASFPNNSPETRPAKRQRINVACTWCRQRKSRCDGTRPKCSSCKYHELDCVYSNTATLTKSSASKEYIESLESRLGALESSLAGVLGRVSRIESGGPSQSVAAHSSPSGNGDTHLDETQDPTDGIGSLGFTNEEESGYFGPSSNIAFTRQIVRATTTMINTAPSALSPDSPENVALQSHLLHVSRPVSPKARQIDRSANIPLSAEPFVLPPEDEVIQLMKHYFNTTGVLFPYINREAFLKTYGRLNSTNIRTVRKSWLGLLNMILAMSMSAGDDGTIEASERAAQSDVFYNRALALCDKQIRHGTSLEVVQLLLLMSQYLQGTEHSIETWNVHGLAVKAAYQLGLHSPNVLKQFPPEESEIRKRTWFGCFALDRTLSMTLGRPCTIPESYIKLDLPQVIKGLETSPTEAQRDVTEEASVQFFNATIKLYTIMGQVLDVLYGSNLGGDAHDNIFETASLLLQFEQKFVAWQRTLPESLALVEQDFPIPNELTATLRFRVILTMRFLNLRILTHRSILCKYLEILSNPSPSPQQFLTLSQIGSNSVRICIQSALNMINIVRTIVTASSPSRRLFGAWWFSLYYTFNAALVIYSGLLIQNKAQHEHQTIGIEDLGLSESSLAEAINSLSKLSMGNRMTERCARYTKALAQMLSIICQPGEPHELSSNGSLILNGGERAGLSILNDHGLNELLDVYDSADLHLGMGFNDIFGSSNFDFAHLQSDSLQMDGIE